MSYETEKVNNIKITPLINQKFNKKTVHGYEWFPNPYCNVALVARTKSGKSNCIYRALEATVRPNTNIIIFCPSVHTDPTYKKMKSMLKQKKCNVKVYEHFEEKGVNHINNLVSLLSEKAEKKNGGGEVKKHGEIEQELSMEEIMFGNHPLIFNQSDISDVPKVKAKPKRKKKGKLAPEYVLIIDDLSSLCRHKSITRLLCKARHMRMRVFVSIHSIMDLQPAAWGQLANIFLFPNISEERIEQIADRCGLSFKGDTKKRRVLCDLYDQATATPYSFLNCNTQEMTFKKNFDEQYKV